VPAWIPTLALLFAATASERESGVVAHWIFDAAHYSEGAFQPLEGEWAMPNASPSFIGEGPTQALLLPPGAQLMMAGAPAPASALPTAELSVEAWVALDNYVTWGGIFSALEDNGAYERGVLLGSRDRNFCLAIASEGKQSLTYLSSGNAYKTGAWYHLVGTYDGEVMRLYENGKLVAESGLQQGPVLYHETHTIATCAYKDQNENYRIVGATHEVKLYDKALKASDIERRYKKLAGKLPVAEGKTLNNLPEEKGTPLHELQPAINQAITDGVDHLLMNQHRDGSWGENLAAYRNGATSLCVYTLLKCGLSVEHPAVIRGLQFLRKVDPVKTYSAGCQLMAIGATHDEANQEWAQEIVDILLDLESGTEPGGWGYPHGNVDLSNTQFAALGFWGASELGVEIPVKVWRRMIEKAYKKHQTFIERVDWPEDGTGEKRSGQRQIAGYSYFTDRGPYHESGCMTTAGLCTIGIPQMLLEKKLGSRHLQMVMKSGNLGFGWLETYYLDMFDEKGHGDQDNRVGILGDNFYYYLYGVERVGAFFNTEFIGDHPWYRDGAEPLVKKQNSAGAWGNQSNTCFALLFLRRASAPRQSGKPASREGSVFADSTGEVHIRATGTKKMTFWIEGFDAAILAEFDEVGRPWKGLRVVKTEYLADGKLVATVPGDPEQPWRSERYASQFSFGLPGDHTLQARVTVVDPEGDPEYPSQTEVFESVALKIATKDSPEEWMAENLAFTGDSLLNHLVVNATASSELEGCGAALAFDESHTTRWVSASGDKAPWIQVDLTRRARANTLVLAQANSALSMRGHFGAIRRLALSVNGDKPLEVDMGPDEMKMIQIDLGKTVRVRQIKISALEFTPGSNGRGVGFSGIELHRL